MIRGRKRGRPARNIITAIKNAQNIKFGKFTADNISLKEACINNLVLRVKMEGLKEKHVPAILKPRIPKFGSLQQMIQKSFRDKILNEKNGFCFQDSSKKVVKRYCLKFSPLKYSHSKVTVDFDKLSEKVCTMKLPTQSWKVTVMMNCNLTAMYYFTNHRRTRSVTFSETNPYFKIIIDGLPVILLGCPKTVSSIRDMEVLLEIVNNISLEDCMVSLL